MAKLTLTMLAAFGEFERELIRERQREGIAIAKSKGVYKGRKKALGPVEGPMSSLYRLTQGFQRRIWRARTASVERRCISTCGKTNQGAMNRVACDRREYHKSSG